MFKKLLSIGLISLALFGCQQNTAETNTATCTIDSDPTMGVPITVDLKGKNDVVNELNMKMTMPYVSLGIEDTESMSDEEMETFVASMEDQLAEAGAKGLSFGAEMAEEGLEFSIGFDLEEVDDTALSLLGLEGEMSEGDLKGLSFEDTVAEFVEQGYTCN